MCVAVVVVVEVVNALLENALVAVSPDVGEGVNMDWHRIGEPPA